MMCNRNQNLKKKKFSGHMAAKQENRYVWAGGVDNGS